MITVVPAGRCGTETLTQQFLRHLKINKCQTLHDGTTHRAVTCSYHFQWPWPYIKVTAVSNSFNWKFCALTWLSWNFVGLLSTSNRSWIYCIFWFSHTYSREINDVLPDLTKLKWCLFHWHCLREVFQTLHDYNIACRSTNSHQVCWSWPCFKVTAVSES